MHSLKRKILLISKNWRPKCCNIHDVLKMNNEYYIYNYLENIQKMLFSRYLTELSVLNLGN